MKSALWTSFFVVLYTHMSVLARKSCLFTLFSQEIDYNVKTNEQVNYRFMLEGFQNNCFIDLDSLFAPNLNATSRESKEDSVHTIEEYSFFCIERVSIHFYTKKKTSVRTAGPSLELLFSNCSVFLEELSLFTNYADFRVITQTNDSLIHLPSQRISCNFSENLLAITSKINCKSMTKFFWEYCKEVFEKVNTLQLEGCATKHVRMKAETLIKTFPHIKELHLKYINLSTQLTFPWTELYTNDTEIRILISSEYQNEKLIYFTNNNYVFQIYNSDIMNMIHLSGMISKIVLKATNFSENQSGIFKKVTGLYHIEISNNPMTEISAQLFKNQTDIKYIYLQDNQLRTVPGNVFEDQRFLRFLDLSKNKLSSIDRNLLKNQQSLKELHLENNNLQALPNNFLKEQIRSLKFLYLYSNPIKTIPVMPFYGVCIEIIDIHNSDITGDSLVELANNISFLDLQYADQEGRQREGKDHGPILDLSFSNIRNIDLDLTVRNKTVMNIMRLFQLFYIKGDGNPLQCNCGLGDITILVKSGINNTYSYSANLDWVCVYPEELKGRKLSSLTVKDLYCPTKPRHCPKLCTCNVGYGYSSSLIIDCKHIKMEALPHVLPKFPSEEIMNTSIQKYPLVLWFKNTSLLELDQRDYLVNVSELDISENKLTHIQPLVASKLRHVSVLNMKNNYITSLPVQIRYINIKRLYLDGNPFNCDCHTKWMKDWLLDRSCPVTDWNTIKCKDSNETVKTLVTIPDSMFVCQKVEIPSVAEHVIFPTTITGSLVFVFVVLSLTIYFQRFTIRVLLYMILGRRICYSFKKPKCDSRYDCVVIYDKSDGTLVDDKVKGHLKELGYNIADIYSDCIIGFTTIDGIKKLINNSNVTLFCLTTNCLNNDLITALWIIACERSLKYNLGSILIILDKEFRNEYSDENMRQFIKNGRYIKFDSILLHKSIEYLMTPRKCFDPNQLGSEYRHPSELDIVEMENADNMNLKEQIYPVTSANEECPEGRKPHILVVFHNHNDELHRLVRYDIIPFLRDRNQNAIVLQDDLIFGEDIREGIEPKLEIARHVIFIVTKEMLEEEYWEFIVSAILTKAFVCNNNYLLMLTYGEIDENKLSKNLKTFFNSHITAKVSDPNIKERILEALLNEESQDIDKEDTESITLENCTDEENLV